MGGLIGRLEAASEGSLELDAAIALFFGAKPTVTYGHELLGNQYTAPNHAPRCTTSLDAALALAERVLPGFWWIVRSDEARGGFGNVGPIADSFKDNVAWPSYAATPALALCIAILRAHQPEQTNG